jgi:hypothetical protein
MSVSANGTGEQQRRDNGHRPGRKVSTFSFTSPHVLSSLVNA